MIYERAHKTTWMVISLLMAIMVVDGCSSVREVPVREIQLHEATEKIAIPISLIITKEYSNAPSKQIADGAPLIIPLIGKSLVHHSKKLMEKVFSSYSVQESGSKLSAPDEGSYKLKPKVLFIEQASGTTSFSTVKTSIGVEWNLLSPSGNPVWVKAITGTGTWEGHPFTGEQRQKEGFQKALNDLFQNTQTEILRSKLLRKLE